MDQQNNILLTGGSGTLGSKIISSNLYSRLIVPSRNEMDITDKKSIEQYFNKHAIDSIIHCAAIARMTICHDNPKEAIKVNIMGTLNLVNSVIDMEKKNNKKIRFIHISTDGVYASESGNYSENSATIPYNFYGWTKLGSECAVRLLRNHIIIRTRFFDPEQILFTSSATDIITSSLPINELVEAIHLMLNSKFIGTINIGGDRLSDFDRYKKYKPSLKPCTKQDIVKHLKYNIGSDASMNCNLWNSFIKEN